MRKRIHLSVSIQGMLNNIQRKRPRAKSLMQEDDGRYLTIKECREYLHECLSKGWKLISTVSDDVCPGFDHFGGGCSGHPITEEEEAKEKELAELEAKVEQLKKEIGR